MAHNSFLEKNSAPPTKPPDLAGEPKSARIKPGSRADIEATRAELMVWLDQPLDPEVHRAAGAIVGDLGAALIGSRVHPVVKAQLIENVAWLAERRAHVTSGLDR